MNPTLPSHIITVILAGGKAKRFGGQDKGEILINEERLIDIIYERLVPQSDEIIISGQHDYGLGIDVVPDAENAPRGPVGGIYSIWKALEGRAVEGFFTIAVDGPNLPDDLISSLYSKASSTVAADEKGQHPTYGWWRLDDLFRAWDMVKLSQSISLNRLADLSDAKTVFWEGDSAFININRQGDLDRLVKGA